MALQWCLRDSHGRRRRTAILGIDGANRSPTERSNDRAGQGYLDDPAATAEAISTAGWLRTGDVGTMDEAGYVRITDRMKDFYISGGFNCYPAEIEKLLAPHPGIAMVAVIGVPDERLGEVGAAFIVPRPGMTLDEADLRGWARTNMANYKVPRRVHIVEDLPRNAAGKITKLELKKRC